MFTSALSDKIYMSKRYDIVEHMYIIHVKKKCLQSDYNGSVYKVFTMKKCLQSVYNEEDSTK